MASAWSACATFRSSARPWLLPVTLEVAADGTIAPPDGAGLGVVPDFEALERYRLVDAELAGHPDYL